MSNEIVKLIKKFCPGLQLNDFKATDSSGASVVYTHPESKWALQEFPKRNCKYIFLLYNRLIRRNTPDVRKYIAHLEIYLPPGIIIWRKHMCLNQLSSQALKLLITMNLHKLLSDVTKALICLKEAGIFHRDVRIDNIGIVDGTFIVFDFDAALYVEEYRRAGGYYTEISDLDKFIVSINFHTDNKLAHQIPQPYSLHEFLRNLQPENHIIWAQND